MSCQIIGGLMSVTAILVAMATSIPSNAHAGGKDTKKKDAFKKDTDQSRYLKQLESRFQEWDDNNDNKLDKSELARAFRGPKAKAFDTVVKLKPPVTPPPKPEPAPKSKLRPIHVALVSLPQHSLFGNVIVAEVLSRPEPPPTPKTTQPQPPTTVTLNYTTFADYQFLQLADKNNDQAVTHQEFANWAKNYARLLDNLEDAQGELKTANKQLQAAKTKQAKLKAQQEVQKHQQEARAANARLDAIPPAIHKALKVRP